MCSQLSSKLHQLRPLNAFITECASSSPSTPPSFTFAVKDIFNTQNIRTTCASNALLHHVPPFDAAVVQRLRDAGGHLVGKTNHDEFSMGTSSSASAFGPVKSPYSELARLHEDWVLPGGSSGGSAVAVAAGICDIAVGSDTGGSVRNPAAHCGCVGLKPSYGRVSRHGMVPLVNSLDVVGIFSRDVRTAARALDILSGQDVRDGTSIPFRGDVQRSLADNDDISGIKIGIPKEYRTPDLSSQIYGVWTSTADLLHDLGNCEVRAVDMPHTSLSILVYHILGECDVASNMARYDGVEYGMRSMAKHAGVNEMYAASRLLSFGHVVRRRILVGNYFLLREHYSKYVERAMRVRRLISNDFSSVFDEVDVLLTPVTSDTAPTHSMMGGGEEGYERERSDDYFTQPVNMAGVCALSLPICHSSPAGLPIGMQLIAAEGREDLLLRVAQWIERRVAFEHLDEGKLLGALASLTNK